MTLPPNLSPDYRFLAIIGHPVEQSLSPFMHNTAFTILGLHYRYAAYDIEPSGLQEAVEELRRKEFIGFNVTIPHKEAIIPLLDDTDYEARTIGAVNTVSVMSDRLIGYNTDVHGVLKSLEPYQEKIVGKKVLVLGSGGAARAVLYALSKYFKPSAITVVARSPKRAESVLASLKMDSSIESFDPRRIDELVSSHFLIINTTPVGMSPNVDASPLPEKVSFRPDQIVFDLIYRPLETTLLKQARVAGALAIMGLEMFIQQGAKAFEIWTGQQMPMIVVRKILEEKLKVHVNDSSHSERKI